MQNYLNLERKYSNNIFTLSNKFRILIAQLSTTFKKIIIQNLGDTIWIYVLALRRHYAIVN